MTWEPAQNIPSQIVQEYEQGLATCITDDITSTGIGQTVHTLSVAASSSATTPARRPVIQESDGYAILNHFM